MKRFLISRLSALGDVVCTLPAAVALKRSFPESCIVWAVDPRFAGVVECCTAVDEVLRLKPGVAPASWPQIEGQFDVAFDMQGLFKSGIIVAKARAGKKLGYHWQREMSWLFTSKVIPDPTSFHVVDQYVDVVRAAGCDMTEAEFDLQPKPQDLTRVKEMLDDRSGPLVIVNPGAGWASKRWPTTHFAALIDRLSEQGAMCVLIGGKAEADRAAAADVVAKCAEPPQSLVGETSVRELIALISMASAHVGGDTGSTHIAAALRVPAIGLYSITRPERSCPYGQFDRCHFDPEALANIRPEQVYLSIKGVLG